nr:DNA-directed RNA polymerase I subunit RPA1 [Onthophagus taurus]
MSKCRKKDSVTLSQDAVEFSVFTAEEIRKLSVVKICSPLTFDALGYPLPGGLYDKLMGPLSDRSEPCGTCFQNIYQCPGHFGHIELTLPVVNGLFTKFILMVLKLTCFHCYHIRIPGHVKHLLSVQLRLLNAGFITEPLEIENKLDQLITESKSMENVQEDELLPFLLEYEEIIKENSLEGKGLNIFNKNTEGMKKELIDSLLKKLKTRGNCMHCNKTLSRITKIRDKLIEIRPSSVQKGMEQKYLNPEEIRRHLRSLYKNEKNFLHQLAPVLKTVKSENPTDIFFFEVIPVPPPNVRPVNFIGGKASESKQSAIYKQILHECSLVRTIVQVLKNRGNLEDLHETAKSVYAVARGNTVLEKLNFAWEALQMNVNNIIDCNSVQIHGGQGLKQIIEKKSGVIRMHMMGKRVNFSGRSVITPDPNINIDEVGVPEEFAKKLTFPVPVTTWNVEELRKLIKNGPNIYPGAVMVEFEDGTINKINPNNPVHQQALMKRLLTPDDGNEGFKGFKTVHRHLTNGDIVLLNRQPTLHRPSIMAHKTRILKGEKTLRLHYANCKAYNADFDGDEMNMHFPQNEFARTEAYNLVNVSNHYLVPKDGTPLSGLIQDHVIAGVRMTIRGKFFDKYDYQKFVFQALDFQTSNIVLLPPTILKPAKLWSGKQIISTVIINTLPKNSEMINLDSTSKISVKSWQKSKQKPWKFGGTPLKDNEMTEAEVIIRQGELLVGVLDKTHIGATPYGLGHCIYELYGGTYATKLLSSFGRLFTSYLQIDGFTLGVKDILVMEKADEKRKEVVEKSREIGVSVIAKALDVPENTSIEEILEKLEQSHANNPNFRNILDRQYKQSLDSYTNDINKVCLPAGLICKFPENNLQLMVQSGAKGSTVNTMQISCLLGQIELEGKRPPVMISGKSLPSFPNFEFSPRAGGFIDARFMTGIQPQEFFFHCMAGREGLIDTAVKTSRSGYLQRCLIKPLEGVTVAYDLTVRDSDKSVIQFFYGEDGLDISKSQFFNDKHIKFLIDNKKVIYDKKVIKQLKEVPNYKLMTQHASKINEWRSNFGDPLKNKQISSFTAFSKAISEKTQFKNENKRSKIPSRTKKTKCILEMWNEADSELKESLKKRFEHSPDPVISLFQPDVYLGSISERLQSLIDNSNTKFESKKERKQFEDTLKLKIMQAVCQPGESVGLLAAQSIGEPSTQMTLNTFHFAGRGEMNVTLGIPRLREILMTASKEIKTPSMQIPFLDVPNLEKKADDLKRILTRVVVQDVLEKIDVTNLLELKPIRQQKYVLKFTFLPYELYKFDYVVKPKKVIRHMVKKFFTQMFAAIKKYCKLRQQPLIFKETQKPKKNNEEIDEEGVPQENDNRLEEESSDEEPEDAEDAKTNYKYEKTHESDEEGEDANNENESDEERDKNEEEEDEDEDKATILNANTLANDYKFDSVNYKWCELTFTLPLSSKKLDMTAILREVASKSVIHETPNIKRAFTFIKDDKLTLLTDGINIVEMFKYNKLLDLNKLYSNDIHKIAETYGIEAAVRVITKEIQDVFKVYGITVDPRHLKLISDYMTFRGVFVPFSRKGMESSASPLQQMSFEASLEFLRGATLGGKCDQLSNPSSSLMVGKPCNVGTGLFGTFYKFFPSKAG